VPQVELTLRTYVLHYRLQDFLALYGHKFYAFVAVFDLAQRLVQARNLVADRDLVRAVTVHHELLQRILELSLGLPQQVGGLSQVTLQFDYGALLLVLEGLDSGVDFGLDLGVECLEFFEFVEVEAAPEAVYKSVHAFLFACDQQRLRDFQQLVALAQVVLVQVEFRELHQMLDQSLFLDLQSVDLVDELVVQLPFDAP